MTQQRRTLAERISSAFDGANLLTVEEISRFTGSSRRTVERNLVPLMRPYHVRDRDDCKDPQSAPIIGYCIHCGGEIYSGDVVFMPKGCDGMVCTDCEKDWIYEVFASTIGTHCEART